MLMAILAIILTLVLVVGIHEAGHALMAWVFGIKIIRVSIGFGKPLLQWQSKRGCQWVWALWPLGGYVQLLNSRVSPVDSRDYSKCFDKVSVWKRILVLFAGALANLIVAWLAFILVYSLGMNYKLPVVQSVQKKTIAANAQIQPGDQLIAIGGHVTRTWGEVGMQLILLWGKKDIKLIVKQATREKLVTMDLSHIQLSGKETSLLQSIGITPDLAAANGLLHSSTVTEAIVEAGRTIAHLIYFFLMIFKQLFLGLIPFSILLGPFGLFAASVGSLMQGLVVFMYFIATLSLAVALVNLFPFPGLDGGSIVYALIEKVRGKPISIATEILVYRLVFIVFCILFVHLLMNDIQRFF